jgi:hypothetical protein
VGFTVGCEDGWVDGWLVGKFDKNNSVIVSWEMLLLNNNTSSSAPLKKLFAPDGGMVLARLAPPTVNVELLGFIAVAHGRLRTKDPFK